MSLVKCPACGNDISSEAKVCIHCGQPMNIEDSEPVMNDSKQNKSVGGISSFVLGIIGIIAWILPIIGAPVTIIGLILGIRGNKSRHSGLAAAGVVLCIIGLLATTVNASIGAYKGINGTLFQNLSIPSSSNIQSTTDTQITPTESLGEVVFCENVDDDLNIIHPANTFSADQQFYVKLTTSANFETPKLNVTIYSEIGTSGGTESIVDSSEQQVNVDWNTVAFPINSLSAGNYKVVFTRESDNKKLGEGKVTIQ